MAPDPRSGVTALELDEGLRRRLHAAGEQIAWSAARGAPRGGSGRTARLHEEEARVETLEREGAATVEVTAGPVGAVVLLLEADRRGAPTELGARAAAGRFPDGSIVGAWGGAALVAASRPTIRDLIELARYALP